MVVLCEREGISVKSYLLAETVHLEVSFFFVSLQGELSLTTVQSTY